MIAPIVVMNDRRSGKMSGIATHEISQCVEEIRKTVYPDMELYFVFAIEHEKYFSILMNDADDNFCIFHLKRDVLGPVLLSWTFIKSLDELAWSWENRKEVDR